jgi:hypothetical protein
MTSVPKPFKFLRPHYIDLQALYETWPPSVSSSALNAYSLVFHTQIQVAAPPWFFSLGVSLLV